MSKILISIGISVGLLAGVISVVWFVIAYDLAKFIFSGVFLLAVVGVLASVVYDALFKE